MVLSSEGGTVRAAQRVPEPAVVLADLFQRVLVFVFFVDLK